MRSHALHLHLVLALLCIVPAAAAESQQDTTSSPGRVRVAVSDRYIRGSLYRFAMGTGYRDLWQAEIDLPVLDLAREGGGLTPTRRFGGLQTAVLGFSGADGRVYTFRGTDKDPSAVLDPMLRDTVIQIVVQDQMAAQHPGGPPVAGVITEAAGVLTIRERTVVMPDDPRLGKFRDEFGGMVGTFFEYPLPSREGVAGFHSASEIIDHEELYDRLSRGQEDVVDIEAFLRARLVDILLGDFDRHRKQWRWAKLPGNSRWQPIPEDRDMAFVRYDGAGPRTASLFVPILQNYKDEFPFIKGLTLHGWEQDRWLLPHLDWSQWEPIVRDLKTRISNDVIEGALAQLPPEYAAMDGERLRKDLRGRRDQWEVGARSFYEHLAREVDIQASGAAEQVDIERSPNGEMWVRIFTAGGREKGATPAFERRFIPQDTDEVRVYLRGGNDSVKITGKNRAIRLRIIGTDGTARVDDSEGGGSRIYDQAAAIEVVGGAGTKVDRESYTPPASNSGFVDIENVPPRDWGFDLVPVPQFGFEPDVGVFVGIGGIYTRYGFRKHAWHHRHQFSAGWATEANQPRIQYRGAVRRENSKLLGELELSASGIEVVRFYGLGNETDDDQSDSFYRVRNQQLRAAPGLQYSILDDRIRLHAGVFVEYSHTRRGSRQIDEIIVETGTRIYGAGNFGEAGIEAQFEYDTRTTLKEGNSDLALPLHAQPAAGYPTGGILLNVRTQLIPPIWDVEETTGAIEGSLAGFYSPDDDGRVVLGLRAGGKQTFGDVPYFQAAYLGGSSFFSGEPTLRGFRAQRFAGEASVFANAEVRVMLGRLKLIVPGDVGVLGFADVGRVFLDGESSKEWHPSGGAGVWFAPLVRTNAISFTVAGSEEDVLVYLRLGFHY